MKKEEILTALKTRYATKKFDTSKTISSDEWALLEESLLLAPSSYGLQPWSFFVVTNKEKREELKKAAWNQAQVTDASHFVVLAFKDKMGAKDVERFIDRTVEVRGGDKSALAEYQNMMVGSLERAGEGVNPWMARQVYIALGFIMFAAAQMGIDSCPMEGIETEKFDKLLGLEGYKSVCAVALGYRASDDKYAQAPKVRFKKEEVIKHI